jgi:hypothetical protein
LGYIDVLLAMTADQKKSVLLKTKVGDYSRSIDLRLKAGENFGKVRSYLKKPVARDAFR